MSIDHFPSKLLENAVNEFAKLPGIGKKTALRLVLHLLKKEQDDVHRFSEAMTRLKDEVRHCLHCHNISDSEVCNICNNTSRDKGVVCVVENIRDVMSIENTQQYRGVYHVLGGIISPMDGIGPSDLEIESLLKRVEEGGIREVIFALAVCQRLEHIVDALTEHVARRGITWACLTLVFDEVTEVRVFAFAHGSIE